MGRKHTKRNRNAESGAACYQALGIEELVYCICTHMDMKTLFKAQRVSKRWHEIISKSPLPQRKLYFQPCMAKRKRVFNPFLLKHFEPIFKGEYPYPRYEARLFYYTLNVPEMSITNMKNGRKVHKAFVRHGASWRRMLVAQPPITAIGYQVQINGQQEDQKAILFPDGLRMGDLYDMVFQAIFTRPGEALRHCCLELGVPPHSNTDVERITKLLGEKPGLMFTSVMKFYADMPCGLNQCTCARWSRADGTCVYIQELKESIRDKKGMRWMFECEEFEETDYLSLGQRF